MTVVMLAAQALPVAKLDTQLCPLPLFANFRLRRASKVSSPIHNFVPSKVSDKLYTATNQEPSHRAPQMNRSWIVNFMICPVHWREVDILQSVLGTVPSWPKV